MKEVPISPFTFIGSRIKKLTYTNPFINLPADAKYMLDADYSVDEMTVNENRPRGIITLSLKVKISYKRKAGSLNLELEGCFDLEDESVDEDAFERMLQINGVAMLYSIGRSILQTITSQSYLGESVALPMINVISLYEQKKAGTK